MINLILTKRLGIYVFFGPLIGLLIIDLCIVLTYIYTAITNLYIGGSQASHIFQDLLKFALINVYAVIVAYIVGSIPALLAGFAAQFCTNKNTECLVAALVGASPFLIMLNLDADFFSLGLLLMLAGVAALSGVVCALVSQ